MSRKFVMFSHKAQKHKRQTLVCKLHVEFGQRSLARPPLLLKPTVMPPDEDYLNNKKGPGQSPALP